MDIEEAKEILENNKDTVSFLINQDTMEAIEIILRRFEQLEEENIALKKRYEQTKNKKK